MPTSTFEPAAGVCEQTCPAGSWHWLSLETRPTTRCAASMAACASVDWVPTRFGTSMIWTGTDTVRMTVAPWGTSTPSSGACATTSPGATVAVERSTTETTKPTSCSRCCATVVGS